MRLIDANALIEVLRKSHSYHAETARDFSLLCRDIRLVKEQPTVDAEPLKHGQWISLTECSNAGVYCSVCSKKVWKEDYAWCNRKNKLRSNYCPNCGAKMDGEVQT